MGLSASQARFLQLTARKSNVEFEAQQITFQRLMLSDKMSEVSSQYQDKTSNMKMTFAYNDGTGPNQIDITYNNYKNFINQQQEGLVSAHKKMYLVSSSGNKIIVANEEDRQKMIDSHSTKVDKTKVDAAVKAIADAKASGDESTITQEQRDLAAYAIYPTITEKNEKNEDVTYYIKEDLKEEDFLIVEDLDDVESFQRAIKDGIYFFAEFNNNAKENEPKFNTLGWETLGGGALQKYMTLLMTLRLKQNTIMQWQKFKKSIKN